MKKEMELGPYLKRLRESRGMSLRHVAHLAGVSSGYLSQIEGGKRGRRKGGEFFAPHPQILQKLAIVYHVDAYDVFERAGYLEDSSYRGFPEEREIDRCFDFVIHDPALKHVFTYHDKRVVIERYEQQTQRKVLTWSAPATPMRKKSTYQGLRLEGDRLYVDSIDMMLNILEVAEELGVTQEEVLDLIAKKHLKASHTDEKGQPLLSRYDLLGLQSRAQNWGLQLIKVMDAEHIPQTSEEYEQAGQVILDRSTEETRKRISAGQKPIKPSSSKGK